MLGFYHYFYEVENYRDQIATGDLGKISIGKLVAFCEKRPEFLKTIPVSKVIHDLSWWQGDKQRMMNANTSYPIIVLAMPDGHWTVTDGLNRLKKVVSIEKKKEIQAYVIPVEELPEEVFL